jgi:hypothetical protein
MICRFGWQVAAPGLRWRGKLRGGRNGYLESMLSVVQAARVVTGSILIIAGLIAIPLPLTPGLPLIIIGLAFGFSWHPKGLRLLRRCKVKWGRLFKKRGPEAQRIG